jgi:hypothetical protein
MTRPLLPLLACAALLPIPSRLAAAELILPENRNAYYCAEAIEFAVAGLDNGKAATVELVPQNKRLTAVTLPLKGDGGTLSIVLPAFSLAPSAYAVQLDGKDAATITVASGVNRSTMLLSQTIGWNDLAASSANFIVGNAFSFGQLDPEGKPLKTFRGRRSAGLDAFDRAVALDLPTLVYMYWTGYVVHKPWGADKSWANPDMVTTMRLFSLHTAQRLRRYGKNIVSVGTLDEPGLAWGKTPAGGTASGFPNWDEQEWYESRGWKYTDDPGVWPDTDWMKYLTVRCGIMKQNDAWAKEDLRSVWPDVVFSTDLYAPQAVMDGTDPLNQQVNDIPSSHVFLDFGTGKLGALSGIYLEKAHDPTAKLAHAMNGQLVGEPVPQPQQRYAYHLMRNAMLAAGLKSNWWLNTGGMKNEDLAAVNEPGQRLGPLFLEMSPTGHDIAVFWSFTEIGMREKEITAKEAKKKSGEQIKLMIASLPENTALKNGKEIEINAYSVGDNYKEQVLYTHQALARAGYPAHIVHEKLLPVGILKNYRTLVLVGQRFALPDDVQKAIADFSAAGGKVVVDKTTTVPFKGALLTEANFKDPYYRWVPLFLQDAKTFKSVKEASYFQTNYFMDGMVRDAVAPLKETMKKTDSRPVMTADTVHLAVERHQAGEGALLMVLNGYEMLPDIADDKKYGVYNYAPYNTTFTLEGIKPDSAVYRVEGLDWKNVTPVKDVAGPQQAEFAPGEMKLYLVAPRAPEGLEAAARVENGALNITAALKGVRMPWPVTVTVKDPDGTELYRVHRSLNKDGRYSEPFPIGANVKLGEYAVTVDSPVAALSAQAKATVAAATMVPAVADVKARVFDEPAIRDFLRGKPDLTIAVGSDSQKKTADRLAADLTAKGIKVKVAAEKDLVHRVRYPRVWDPTIKVHRPTDKETKPAGMTVQVALTLETTDEGRTVARTADGQDLGDDWRKPHTQAKVGGKGFIDFGPEQFYEPGCVLYVDDKGQTVVVKGEIIEVKATEETRRQWSRAWVRLASFVGTDHLPPQLPEAYAVDSHLILLGDSTGSELVAALQASDLLPQVVDPQYPGPGKALVLFAWSPFALGKNVILIGASDEAGLAAGGARLLDLAARASAEKPRGTTRARAAPHAPARAASRLPSQ